MVSTHAGAIAAYLHLHCVICTVAPGCVSTVQAREAVRPEGQGIARACLEVRYKRCDSGIRYRANSTVELKEW